MLSCSCLYKKWTLALGKYKNCICSVTNYVAWLSSLIIQGCTYSVHTRGNVHWDSLSIGQILKCYQFGEKNQRNTDFDKLLHNSLHSNTLVITFPHWAILGGLLPDWLRACQYVFAQYCWHEWIWESGRGQLTSVYQHPSVYTLYTVHWHCY